MGALQLITAIRSSDENIESDVAEPRRGKKALVAKKYWLDYMVYTLEEDPTSLQEELSSMNVDFWRQEAIKDDMDSLESNKT